MNIQNHQPQLIEQEPLPGTEEEDPIQKSIQSLYKENSDLMGWIQIEGTNINYPVMYTKEVDYYLRRDFYKNDDQWGSIFVDPNNTLTPRDSNLIIYGHNMKDDRMFHDLVKYQEESFYQEHPKIIFYTLTTKEEYTIISVFLSKVYSVVDSVFKYYKFHNATSQEEYRTYIENIKAQSLYPIEETATFNEDLITLSTCEYSQKNGRMVVVAKKITKNQLK